MNRADAIQRDALKRRAAELEAEAAELEAEVEALRRRVLELEAERQPTTSVPIKTLRIAEEP